MVWSKFQRELSTQDQFLAILKTMRISMACQGFKFIGDLENGLATKSGRQIWRPANSVEFCDLQIL